MIQWMWTDGADALCQVLAPKVVYFHYTALQENLHEWCIDKRGRDQFAIRYLEETEIFYNDAQRSLPEAVYKRNCWTELFVQWSPHGSYIATLHRQGVAIWGGTSFQRLMRWPHPGVRARSLLAFPEQLWSAVCAFTATPVKPAVLADFPACPQLAPHVSCSGLRRKPLSHEPLDILSLPCPGRDASAGVSQTVVCSGTDVDVFYMRQRDQPLQNAERFWTSSVPTVPPDPMHAPLTRCPERGGPRRCN